MFALATLQGSYFKKQNKWMKAQVCFTIGHSVFNERTAMRDIVIAAGALKGSLSASAAADAM
ncbi:MAG: hypothetical protein CUN53_16780, partial [Phototrophicales bacterium]